jgi:hypothetical protein
MVIQNRGLPTPQGYPSDNTYPLVLRPVFGDQDFNHITAQSNHLYMPLILAHWCEIQKPPLRAL